jgi:hypothetical protein
MLSVLSTALSPKRREGQPRDSPGDLSLPGPGGQRLPARWLFHWTYNGLVPYAKPKRSLERFALQVVPRFRTDSQERS